MPDLVELTWQLICLRKLRAALLAGEPKMFEVMRCATVEGDQKPVDLVTAITQMMDGRRDWSHANFSGLQVGDRPLQKPSARVFRYVQGVDLEIHFEAEAHRLKVDHEALAELRTFMAEVAVLLGAKAFQAGLEPSKESANQFFSSRVGEGT